MSITNKSNFFQKLFFSLLLTSLTSILLLFFFLYGELQTKDMRCEEKIALLESIATDPNLANQERIDILEEFANRYQPTYEGDSFYNILINSIITVKNKKIPGRRQDNNK